MKKVISFRQFELKMFELILNILGQIICQSGIYNGEMEELHYEAGELLGKEWEKQKKLKETKG